MRKAYCGSVTFLQRTGGSINLQIHHIWFRSACGPDAAWNRTTLRAYHRGGHAGRLALRGRAPHGLI